MSTAHKPHNLKPCASCGKRTGELKITPGAKFPYHIQCSACGFSTEPVKLPGIAVARWTAAKPVPKD